MHILAQLVQAWLTLSTIVKDVATSPISFLRKETGLMGEPDMFFKLFSKWATSLVTRKKGNGLWGILESFYNPSRHN